MNDQKFPILFYDGECNLCHGLVQFILKYDIRQIIYFSHLQSSSSRKLLLPFNVDVSQLKSVYYLKSSDCLHSRSTAIVHILRDMGSYWLFFAALLWIIPFPIRDFIYSLIAKYRYKIFGKHTSCRRPSSMDRFVE